MWKLILFLVLLPPLAFMLLCGAVCICAKWPWKPKRAVCLVVLGAGIQPDGGLKNTLRKRCDAAAEAWKQGMAEYIILCGGQGRREPCTEASAMVRYLAAKGIPEDAMLQEGDSANTQENLRNARLIMEQNGWKTAAIVTSDYHIRRSLWIARDLRIPACGIACGSPDSFSAWIRSRVKETASWFLYFLRRI